VTTHARPRLHYAKVLAFAYAVWFLSFEAVGRYAATLPTTDLTSAWDRALPLIPAFIWPYELCYALPFFSLFVIHDWRRFNVALLAILLASVTAFVVYLLVPVAFPRPALGTSLSERLIALEYAADFSPGANKLPSMHVALSWIMGAAMYRQRGRVVDGVVLVSVVAITASTVFVKQHLLFDVAAGIVWGLLAFRLASWLLVRFSRSGDVHRV